MSVDSIHDAVLCAERRARTPARSIDAAIVKEPAYGCDCRLANGIIDHAFHNRACVPRRLIAEWVFARVCALLENVILREQRPSDRKCAVSHRKLRLEKVKRGGLSPCEQLKAQPLIASIWLANNCTGPNNRSPLLRARRLSRRRIGLAVYSVKYFAARDCAPGPNTLAAALLPSSFRNKDFASFFCCSDTSA
jgi:hypothetical protein